MAMLNLFVSEFRQLKADAARDGDAGRLHRKLVRKEIGMAIVALGAMVMFLDAAQSLAVLVT